MLLSLIFLLSLSKHLKCFLFLPFSQRMIAKTVKIVRGCRSQPYGEWSGRARTHSKHGDDLRVWLWIINVGYVRWTTGVWFFFILQCRHLHSGGWQTGCFWKGLRHVYLHVSCVYLHINSSDFSPEGFFQSRYISGICFPPVFLPSLIFPSHICSSPALVSSTLSPLALVFPPLSTCTSLLLDSSVLRLFWGRIYCF